MPVISLSTGETVKIKDKWTHKAAKTYMLALNKDVDLTYKFDGTGYAEKKIPAQNLELAYEEVMPFMIDEISQDSSRIHFTKGWLDDLTERDYGLIEQSLIELRASAEDTTEREKNTGEG